MCVYIKDNIDFTYVNFKKCKGWGKRLPQLVSMKINFKLAQKTLNLINQILIDEKFGFIYVVGNMVRHDRRNGVADPHFIMDHISHRLE